MSELKLKVIELLKKEANILDFNDPDNGDGVVYFHTKGDSDNRDDPQHKLSESFYSGLTSLGIDPDILYENDCEGCAGEFMLELTKVEAPEVIQERQALVSVGRAMFEAAVAECRRLGLSYKDVWVAGGGGKTEVNPNTGRLETEFTVQVGRSKK